MKKDKAKLPAKKRGRKPKTEKTAVSLAGKMPITAQKSPATGKMENYSFTINGVAVTVSSKAKKIHIAPDVMVVSFKKNWLLEILGYNRWLKLVL